MAATEPSEQSYCLNIAQQFLATSQQLNSNKAIPCRLSLPILSPLPALNSNSSQTRSVQPLSLSSLLTLSSPISVSTLAQPSTLELPNHNNHHCNSISINKDGQGGEDREDANSLRCLNFVSSNLFQPILSDLLFCSSSNRIASVPCCSGSQQSNSSLSDSNTVHGCHHQSQANNHQLSSHQPQTQGQSQSKQQCSNMSKYSIGSSSHHSYSHSSSIYPSSSSTSSGASSPCSSSLPGCKSNGGAGGLRSNNLGAKINYHHHHNQNHHNYHNQQNQHNPGTTRNKPHYFQHHSNNHNGQHHQQQHLSNSYQFHYQNNQFEPSIKSTSSSSCNSPVQTVLLSPVGSTTTGVVGGASLHINRQSIKHVNHNTGTASAIGSNCSTPTKSMGIINKPDILLDRKAFISLEKSINWKLLLNSSSVSSSTTTSRTTSVTSSEMSTTSSTITTTTSATTTTSHHLNHNQQTIKSTQSNSNSNSNSNNNNNNCNEFANSTISNVNIVNRDNDSNQSNQHSQQQQQPNSQHQLKLHPQQSPNLDFTLPGMKDVPSWLKLLRLHKYASFFARMSYEEMLNLTETDLEHRNITKGARQKLILSIQKLKARSAVLLVSEYNFLNCSENSRTHRGTSASAGYNTTISYTALSHVLFQIRAFLSTPIRPSFTSTCTADSGAAVSVGCSQLTGSNYPVVIDYCAPVVSHLHSSVSSSNSSGSLSLSPAASNSSSDSSISLISASVDASSASASSIASPLPSLVDVNNNSNLHQNYQNNSSTLSSRHFSLADRSNHNLQQQQPHQQSPSNVQSSCSDNSLLDNVSVDHQQLLQCWSTLSNDYLPDIMTRLIGHVHHILVSKCKKRLKKLKLWQYFFKDIYDKLLILNNGAKLNEINALDQYEIRQMGKAAAEQSPISTSQVSNESDREDEDEEDSALVDCDNDGSSLLDKDTNSTGGSSNSSTPKTFQHCSGSSSVDKDSGVDEAAGDSDNSSDSEILRVEHEEELYSMMRTVLDKCLSHEAFEQYSILFVHWREQLQLMINSLHYIVNDSLLISSLSPPLAPIDTHNRSRQNGYCDLGGDSQSTTTNGQSSNGYCYPNNSLSYSSTSSQYSNFAHSHHSSHHSHHRNQSLQSSPHPNSFQSTVSHKSMSPTSLSFSFNCHNNGAAGLPNVKQQSQQQQQSSKNINNSNPMLCPISPIGVSTNKPNTNSILINGSASLSQSTSSLSSPSSTLPPLFLNSQIPYHHQPTHRRLLHSNASSNNNKSKQMSHYLNHHQCISSNNYQSSSGQSHCETVTEHNQTINSNIPANISNHCRIVNDKRQQTIVTPSQSHQQQQTINSKTDFGANVIGQYQRHYPVQPINNGSSQQQQQQPYHHHHRHNSNNNNSNLSVITSQHQLSDALVSFANNSTSSISSSALINCSNGVNNNNNSSTISNNTNNTNISNQNNGGNSAFGAPNAAALTTTVPVTPIFNANSPEINFRKLLLQQLMNNQQQQQQQPKSSVINCNCNISHSVGCNYSLNNSQTLTSSASTSTFTLAESQSFNSLFNSASIIGDNHKQLSHLEDSNVNNDTTNTTADDSITNSFNFSTIDFDDCRKQWDLQCDSDSRLDGGNISGGDIDRNLYKFNLSDTKQIVEQNNCWSNGAAYFDSKLNDIAEFNGNGNGNGSKFNELDEFTTGSTGTGTIADKSNNNTNLLTFSHIDELLLSSASIPTPSPPLLTSVGTSKRNDHQIRQLNRIEQNVAGGGDGGSDGGNCGANRDNVDCDDDEHRTIENNNCEQLANLTTAKTTATTSTINLNNSITDFDDIEQLCIRMAEHALEI